MTIRLKFKDKLNEYETKTGIVLSQRDLADAMGISLGTTFNLLHGNAGRFELIDKLCKYLNCQPGDLLEYEIPRGRRGRKK